MHRRVLYSAMFRYPHSGSLAAWPGYFHPGGAPGVRPFAVLTRPARVGAFPPVWPTCRFLVDPLRRYRSEDRSPWNVTDNEAVDRGSATAASGNDPRRPVRASPARFAGIEGETALGFASCRFSVTALVRRGGLEIRLGHRPLERGINRGRPLTRKPAHGRLCPLPGPIRSWALRFTAWGAPFDPTPPGRNRPFSVLKRPTPSRSVRVRGSREDRPPV